MQEQPNYFSVGATIMPNAAGTPSFSQQAGASTPASPSAGISDGPVSARPADDFPDGAQSFQDLDISSPPTEREADATAPQAADSPFHVTVTDPVRQGEGMHAYMVYHVNTKTSLPQFQLGEFRVARRYRDFDWLFHQLADNWPGVIVPPLPEKALAGRVTGVGFTPEFIESRRKALELFLRRVTSHAELQQAECVQVFLEASEDALEAAKASSKAASGRQGNWGQLLSEGWQGLRSYYGMSLGGMGMSGATPEGGIDRQCAELKGYVARVEAQLGALHRAVERLVKRHRAASSGMNDLGLAFAQLGTNADNDLSQALARSLAGIGVSCDSAARTLGAQADSEADALEEPLRDALRLLQQCRHAIHARESAFHAWQVACTTRDARRTRAARAIGAESGDAKAQQMASEVSEGEALVRQTQAEYEQIKERTNREITRFQEEVMHDVKSVLLQFVRLQSDGAQREHTLWAQALPKLDLELEGKPNGGR
mmetsp:Transcript_4846/g.12497  ORF Transcript_4846/g.12497 Transcript_4846/m.12497 type:complete len:486 (-) Transcript_4846:407-1864(-)